MGRRVPAESARAGCAGRTHRSDRTRRRPRTRPPSHPVRLASDVAVLDQLSCGRLILGLSFGYIDKEYDIRGRAIIESGTTRRRHRGTPSGRHENALLVYRAIRRARRHSGGATCQTGWWSSSLVGAYSDEAVRRAGVSADGHLIGRGSPHIIESANRILVGVRRPDDPFSRVLSTSRPCSTRKVARRARPAARSSRRQPTYQSVQHGANVYSSMIPGVLHPPVGTNCRRAASTPMSKIAGNTADVVLGAKRVIDQLQGWSSVHLVLRVRFPGEPTGCRSSVCARLRTGCP